MPPIIADIVSIFSLSAGASVSEFFAEHAVIAALVGIAAMPGTDLVVSGHCEQLTKRIGN